MAFPASPVQTREAPGAVRQAGGFGELFTGFVWFCGGFIKGFIRLCMGFYGSFIEF